MNPFKTRWRRWREDRLKLQSAELTGWIEPSFFRCLFFLRLVSLSYWLTSPIPDGNKDAKNKRFHWDVDTYLLSWSALLAVLLKAANGSPPTFIAAYVVAETFLVLSSITFLCKVGLNRPPRSIERSAVLLVLNLGQIVLAFAIFYRYHLGLKPLEALVQSALVLGTVDSPHHGGNCGLAAVQVILGLVFLALFLTVFIGQLGGKPDQEAD